NSLSWTILLHHSTHTHPFLGPVTGNGIPFTTPSPEDLAAAARRICWWMWWGTSSRRRVQEGGLEIRAAVSRVLTPRPPLPSPTLPIPGRGGDRARRRYFSPPLPAGAEG